MKFLLVLLLLATNSSFAKWSLSTYNIRNFDHDYQAGPTNLAELEKIILSIKSDVMGFQEIVNVPAFEKVMKKTLSSYQLVKSSCGGGGKQKLALAFDRDLFSLVSAQEDLRFSSEQEACGSLRPGLIVTLLEKKTKKRFVFAVLHLKAGGDYRAFRVRWEQYKLLGQLAQEHKKASLIILGDLNTTGYNIRNEDFQKFEDFLGNADFRTVAESVSCTNYWHGADQNPDFEPSILDHIVVPDQMYAEIQDVKVGAHCQQMGCRSAEADHLGLSFEAVSDHCPVQVTFK